MIDQLQNLGQVLYTELYSGCIPCISVTLVVTIWLITMKQNEKWTFYSLVRKDMDVNEHERNVNEHERDVNEHERDVNEHERDVNEHDRLSNITLKIK